MSTGHNLAYMVLCWLPKEFMIRSHEEETFKDLFLRYKTKIQIFTRMIHDMKNITIIIINIIILNHHRHHGHHHWQSNPFWAITFHGIYLPTPCKVFILPGCRELR
jgi:hypothetical protein